MSYRGNAWANVQSRVKPAALKVSGCSRGGAQLWRGDEVLLRNSFNCYGEFPVSLSWFFCCYCDTILTKKQLSGGKGLCCISGYRQALREARTGPGLITFLTQNLDLHRTDATQSGLGNLTSVSNQDKPSHRDPWASTHTTQNRRGLIRGSAGGENVWCACVKLKE